MTFDEALEKLQITEYRERILNSNSHGELSHLSDYVEIAEAITLDEDIEWFKNWFTALVKWAEETWKRPESIFQHVKYQLTQQ